MATATLSNTDRLRELGTAPIGKILLKYSLPAVVGTVVSAIYNIIDSIVIGHAIDDPNVVSGIAVTFPVMTLVTALGMLIGAGAATRVSIVLGQNDKKMAETILGNCVQLTLIIGIVYVGRFPCSSIPYSKCSARHQTPSPTQGNSCCGCFRDVFSRISHFPITM